MTAPDRAVTSRESVAASIDGASACRLAEAVATCYRRNPRSVERIAKGMGTANWLVRTSGADYFLKQYPPHADLAGEREALELSRWARAAGVPVPRVVPTAAGDLLASEGDLALALIEYLPDTTSGGPLSRSETAQAGHVLGRLHDCLRERPGFRDISAVWLALDERRKRGVFERYLQIIESRDAPDDFDRRTACLLRRRLELLPRSAALLASLPPLVRQVVHGDYSLWNVLFRAGDLVAVVDFRPPETFLPAFEIGRAALPPESMNADPGWMGQAVVFVEAYCRANPGIPRSELRFAPHVWAIQLVRSEYGVRQHYLGPLERQAELDRFWFERCAAAEMILDNLAGLSERFISAWERRGG